MAIGTVPDTAPRAQVPELTDYGTVPDSAPVPCEVPPGWLIMALFH